MHVIFNSYWSKYSPTLIKFWTQCIQKIEHFYELLLQLSKNHIGRFCYTLKTCLKGGLITIILGGYYVLCLPDYDSNY